MLITAIERQKKNGKRFSVFIDGEFSFGIDGVDLLAYKLKEGMEISEEFLREIDENNGYIRARDKAVSLVTARLRSEAEIRRRLLELDFSERIVERVVALLLEHGYLDDVKFATAFCADRIKFGKIGTVGLRYELRQKGVSREIADSVVDGLNFDEEQLARSLLLKKYGEGGAAAGKAVRYLCGKGFPAEVSKEAAKKEGFTWGSYQ